MDLMDIVKRRCPPEPWDEGSKIPWNDPAFSERMLAMHLSQEHDWASRRLHFIEAHAAWIDAHLLQGPSRILDLGCGPGLYLEALARRGHGGSGIDFGPSSIDHARRRAEERGLDLDYRLADVREGGFGTGYDLAMMIFGELNVFRPEEAGGILRRAAAALKLGGRILCEVHTFDEVKRQGEALPCWHSVETGLFSEKPHLWLEEHAWHETARAAVTRYLIVDAAEGSVDLHASTMQAYDDGEYLDRFREAGFAGVEIREDMGEAKSEFTGKLRIVTGIKG